MLKLRGKELSGKQLNRVSHVERTNNPLFLKIILEVQLVFGIFFVIVSIYKTRIRATLSLLFRNCARLEVSDSWTKRLTVLLLAKSKFFFKWSKRNLFDVYGII